MLIIPLIKTKHNFFQSAYFSSIIIEWNKLDPTIRNAKGFGIIKSNILKFIRFFYCYIHKGIRLMARLCLRLTHLH